MATVVITGSTRGIGRSMANDFTDRGHNVVISSRNADDAGQAASEISARGNGKAVGQACDASVLSDQQALWDRAVSEFGSVDYWINNAGNATSRWLVHEMPESNVHTLINSNLKGATFGSQVAVRGFREQGHGALYNTLGGSFQGKMLTPNMGIYSATKAAIHRLSLYLAQENKDQGIIVGMISPGLLITEAWIDEQKHMDREAWESVRPTLNILCDYVEDVTPWITEQILANTENGKRIAWLTGGKMGKRFFDAKVLRKKRDLFSRFDL